MLLGPLANLIILCFENKSFVSSMGFVPNKDNMVFFTMQTVMWILFATQLIIVIYDRVDSKSTDDTGG